MDYKYSIFDYQEKDTQQLYFLIFTIVLLIWVIYMKNVNVSYIISNLSYNVLFYGILACAFNLFFINLVWKKITKLSIINSIILGFIYMVFHILNFYT